MFGILKSEVNTGSIDELATVFTAPLQVINNDPVNSKDTLNLKRKISKQNVQRFEVTAGITPSVGDSTMLVMTADKGHASTYYIRMPQVALMPTTVGNIATVGTKLANSDTIDFAGATKLVPGEFINIGSDPKVYLVLTSGSAGVGAKIHPPLRRTAANGSVIKTGKAVTLQAYLNTDMQLGIVYTDGILSDPGQMSFVEKLQ